MACRAAARQGAPGAPGARGAPVPPRAADARTAANPVLVCAGVAVLAVAADVASKAWALSRLSGGRDIAVAGGLIRLRLVINHGAAFGLGAGLEPLLSVVALLGARPAARKGLVPRWPQPARQATSSTA
jgi:hypothetical protein